MRMVDLILKKREGVKLHNEEIEFIVKNYTSGLIPDYQMAAWAMAVYFKGMDAKEIAELTTAMVKSGEEVDLSPIKGIKVDKHSTGGVGDTTTLILAPLVAAAGVPVAKMSGRGLGHTGGTIDKLESIPGFHTELSKEEFFSNVNKFNVAVVGQSGNLAPADKKLYSLRDVTGTVDSIPLIASSIMSKKIASGADAIVLDVKFGNGAFMKTLEKATELGQTMVTIGKHVGRRTIAVISDMNQPLGFAIGNALEVKEAIATLSGKGPADLTELCLVLGAHMAVLAEKQPDFDSAYQSLKKLLESGEAISKFKEFVSAQGGDASIIDFPDRLPSANYQVEVKAEISGYIHQIQAEEIGKIAMRLGAGRKTKEDNIDLAAGIVLKKKVGDSVSKGDVLAILHTNQTNDLEEVQKEFIAAYQIENKKVQSPSLIYEVIV